MGRTSARGRLRVGIHGASGYMGGEALRVLLEHPFFELAWATSRSPGPVSHSHPNLHGSGVAFVHPDETGPADAVLVALPTARAIDAVVRHLEDGARVVDLGAAFRLRDRQRWERAYGMAHPHWALAEEAVYGIPELHRREIEAARLVANPGCFSSAAILGLAPLLDAGWIEPERIVVDGLSGSTGTGAEPDRASHHAELGGNLIPYQAVGHRHGLEMEQELSLVAGEPVTVHFTPVYVPIVRGILALCHAVPRRTVSREEVLELLRDFYADDPFVRVWDLPPDPEASWSFRPYPWVSAVAGTNACHVGCDVDPERGRIVIVSVLDSIGKGGAQVGVENLNLLFGLDRAAGLARFGRHPA